MKKIMKESNLKNKEKTNKVKKIGYDKLSVISKTLYFWAMLILTFIFSNILISSTLFIFKISVTKITFFVSLIISIIVYFILTKKNNVYRKKWSVLLVFIPIFMIATTIFLNGKVYDYTWDGNSYHKTTIGMMIEGWNPVYEKIEDFDKKDTTPINVKQNSSLWANHYAKASHIFAANIGKVTNNIESGKCINSLSILMLFMFVLSYLLHKTKRIIFPVLFSLCTITCPTIVSQFLTNYVDILVYIFFFQTILSFFWLEKSDLFKTKNEHLMLYFMTLVIAINIKFSLFGYAGIFCMGYFIWYLYRLKKKEKSKKEVVTFTVISTISVIVALLVVGLSVYPKNFIEKGHPFYPIRGKNKVEIMIQNQPDYFKKKTPIEKFIIATFSKADNIIEASGTKAEYKIPFTVYQEEKTVLSSCDLRISGNGILFSGILILCLGCFIYSIGSVYKKDKTLFFLMTIPVVIMIGMIFTLSESWWARYFPQLHLLVFMSLITLYIKNTKLSKGFLYVIVALLAINNFWIFRASVKSSIKYTQDSNMQYSILEAQADPKKCDLDIYTGSFDGAIYNITDRESKYNIRISNKEKYEKNISEYYKLMNGYVLWHCEEK